MTQHLLSSFRLHLGERGCHFYDDETCHFLTWKEVFTVIKEMSPSRQASAFADKLTYSLANYNPDHEFLAVQQSGSQISVELYCEITGGKTLKR
jgi:hypothetical protein